MIFGVRVVIFFDVLYYKKIFSLDFDMFDCNVDQDGDGYLGGVDCDDSNLQVNFGVQEIFNNGIDEDCDGFDIKLIVCVDFVVVIMVYFNLVEDQFRVDLRY